MFSWASILKWIPGVLRFLTSGSGRALRALLEKLLSSKDKGPVAPTPNDGIPDVIRNPDEFYLEKGDSSRSDDPINLAVIVGHTESKQGATAYNGVSEFRFNSLVAKFMERYASNLDDINIQVLHRDRSGRKGVAKAVAALSTKPDVTLELHFNGFRSVAYGCEALVLKGDDKSEELGRYLSHAMRDDDRFQFSLRRGGIKELRSTTRGYSNLALVRKYAKVPVCILFEPTFCTFETKESRKLMQQPREYAELLVDSIIRYYGL